jgi:multisubunit Na+/H+ antiporter MnhB subunit
MGGIRIDPKQQFSKRLARWTSFFWFLYMTWLSVLMMLQPDAALYSVYMGIIATAVMILNVWAYTKNSIYEKGALALLDKAKLELMLGNVSKDKDDGEEETEVSNG